MLKMMAHQLRPLAFDDPDDDATPIACAACGGEYRRDHGSGAGSSHRVIECRWCDIGRQSPRQRERWERHKNRVSQSGLRRKVTA